MGPQVYDFSFNQLGQGVGSKTLSQALPAGVLRRMRFSHTAWSPQGSGSYLPSNITVGVTLTSDAQGKSVWYTPFSRNAGTNLSNFDTFVPPGDGLSWEGRLYLPPGTFVFVRWTNYDLSYPHTLRGFLEVET